MRTGLYKGLSNEELVKLYKAGDTGAFDELMKKTEALRSSLAQRYLNIPGKLSDKERVVVNLLMAGNSKPDIARRLGVKTPSVHSYVKRIATKINLSGAYA